MVNRWVLGLSLSLTLYGCGGSTSDGAPSGSTSPFFYRIEPLPEQVALADDIPGSGLTVAVIDATSDGSVAVGMSGLSFTASDGTFTFWDAPFRWTAKTGTVALGDLPGATPDAATGLPTYVLAMTPDGSVLVGATASERAFRWTESEGMVDVTPAGVTSGRATLVSDDGSVVVGTGDSQPFRWTKSGGAVLLGALSGQFGASPYLMSRDGKVVAGTSGGGIGPLFRWTEATGMTSAGTLPGCTSYQVSGSWPPPSYGETMTGTCSGAGGNARAFVWSERTGLEEVDLGPQANDSWPHAVSTDGSVVVGITQNDGGVSSLARWTRASGTSETLGSPVEFHPSGLGRMTMSTDGSMVVWNDMTSSFQWSSESGTFPLEPLFGNQTYVSGVSGDGRTIAGVSGGAASPQAVVWTAGVPVRVADLLVENNLQPTNDNVFSFVVAGRSGHVLYGDEVASEDRKVGWIAWLP